MQEKNSLFVWFSFLNTLVDNKQIKIHPSNPKVLLLGADSSSMFLAGRDKSGELFFGIPNAMMPFFTQVDWSEISISHELEYLFLEARAPDSKALSMALGIKLSRRLLKMFSVKERSDDMVGFKVFEHGRSIQSEIFLSNQNEVSGLPIKVLNNMADMLDKSDRELAKAKVSDVNMQELPSWFTPDQEFPKWFTPIADAFR